MTVTASAGYRKDYTGNGVTVNWPVPFYFLDASHLRVILTDLTTLTVSDLVLNSDYTVAGAGVSSGGSVTTATVYSSNYRITILRNVPLEQQTHYVEGDPFPATSHEQGLDKLTMIVQQQAEALNRAVTGNAGSTATYTLPYPQAGMALGWDATGTNLVNVGSESVALAAQLGDTTIAVNGSGMIGFNYSLSYAAGTVGKAVKDVMDRATAVEGRATAVEGRATVLEGRVGSLGPQSALRTTDFTLDATHAGKMQVLGGAGIKVTLPATHSVPSGSCFILRNDGSGRATIDWNWNSSVGTISSYIEQEETIILQSNGVTAYRLLSRSMNSLGLGQTWSAPTRSFGTTYTNSTGRSIMVLATAGATATGNNLIAAYINNTSIGESAAYTGDCSISFIVPPGATYKVSIIAGSMIKSLWYELS